MDERLLRVAVHADMRFGDGRAVILGGEYPDVAAHVGEGRSVGWDEGAFDLQSGLSGLGNFLDPASGS